MGWLGEDKTHGWVARHGLFVLLGMNHSSNNPDRINHGEGCWYGRQRTGARFPRKRMVEADDERENLIVP